MLLPYESIMEKIFKNHICWGIDFMVFFNYILNRLDVSYRLDTFIKIILLMSLVGILFYIFCVYEHKSNWNKLVVFIICIFGLVIFYMYVGLLFNDIHYDNANIVAIRFRNLLIEMSIIFVIYMSILKKLKHNDKIFFTRTTFIILIHCIFIV